MDNLKLIVFREFFDASLNISCFTIDSFRKTIYAITKSNKIVSIDQKSKSIKIVTDIVDSKIADSPAVYIELFVENDSLHIFFENGHILSFSIESNETNCVGYVEEGIDAVSSSADQEHIALLSKKDKLFLFTRFFDVLVEKDLHANHSECIKKVDVGWGSKKTQFHGSEGKEAAKVTGEPLEPPVVWDDLRKRVCWRGDGLYFVTSSIHPEKNHRVLRVWNNEGLLQYESEYVAGLEHSLAWRPEGNLIASSRFYNNIHEIVFFEKNGLRHGQFTLPIPHTTFVIKHLTWSTDSSILLVHGFKEEEKLDYIYLYTMRNYHYYLKQCYKFEDKVELISWEPSSKLAFTAFTSNGTMKQCSYIWTNDFSDGTAAVIDGNKVQLTPFDRVNIPPPMSAYSIIFEKPINEIYLHSPEVLMSCTCDGDLILVKLSQSNDDKPDIKIEMNVRNTVTKAISGKILCHLPVQLPVRHLCLIDEKTMVIARKSDSKEDELVLISLTESNSPQISRLADFDEDIIILAYNKNTQLIVVQLGNYSVKMINLSDSKISDWFRLPAKLITMKVVLINGDMHLLGLSGEGSLYFDDVCKPFLENSCSSFLIHQEKYLISTGNDNLLRCNLLDSYFIIQVLPTGVDPRDEPRSIERRSKLVISVENDARVILQMPRGNLESIHPRVILLDLLKQLLSAQQFGVAFNMMRRNRINLNLLVDHEFDKFAKNLSLLIEQVGNDVQNICLFLSELVSEQVTRTMYKFAYLDEGSYEFANKLHSICSQMRDIMMKTDRERYFIPILVTFVKDEPSQIDQALKMIHDQGQGQLQDEAIRYLNYLIDNEKLYKEALGTYDFDIFLMIAAKSNKDPKEYHAYLNKLRSFKNPYYRQFRIDVDLKRFDKALINMNQLKEDEYRDECLAFITNNRIYWSAVKVISPDHPWISSIWEMFGDYLLIKKYYEEAGIAYEKAKSILNAIKAYQLSENWQIAIELASLIPDYDRKALCESFILRLLANRNFLDAAYIEETYLGDKKSAFWMLMEGHHWAKANRLIGPEPDEEFKKTLVSKLSQEAGHFTQTIQEKRGELGCKVERLKVVEETKQKAFENESHDQPDDDEAFSDISSLTDSSLASVRSGKSKGDVVSLVTRKTHHKNKKHLKKYSLKEGSANEDIALRKLIKEMIESCYALTEEAQPLIRWLFFHNLCDLATRCQSEFSTFMEFVDSQIKTVWPDTEDTMQSINQLTTVKVKRLQNLAARCLKEPDAFVPPKVSNRSWKLALIQD